MAASRSAKLRDPPRVMLHTVSLASGIAQITSDEQTVGGIGNNAMRGRDDQVRTN
jgi:hypothetical protein